MIQFIMVGFLNQFKSVKIYIIVYASIFPIILIPATWNVDLIHDASVMVPAGALVHGKVLYSDVYSIFGPLSSWINYFPLKTIGVYLLVSRIVGAILFWITSLLLYFILRKYIDYKLSLAISIMWLLTASGFITLHPGHAKLLFYSTNLGVLLMLISFLILSTKKITCNNWHFRIAIASFVMMAGVTTRVEFFLSWLFVLVAMMLFIKLSKLVVLWFIGGAVFILIYTLGLSLTGVLPKFISSNIFYTKILAEINNPFGTTSGIFYVLLPFLLWIVPALMLAIVVTLLNKVTNLISLTYIIALTLIFLILYNSYGQIIDKTLNGISFFRWLDLIMGNVPISYIGFILVFYPFSFLIRFNFIRKRIDESKIDNEIDLSIIYLPAAASTYLYLHNLNLMYAHAFAPIIMLGLVSLWKDKITPSSSAYGMIAKGIVLLIVLSSSIFVQNINFDRYYYKTEFLKGMSDVSNQKAIEIDIKFASVKSKYLVNEHFEFKCSEWLLALDQNYYYPNRFYDTSERYNNSWCGLRTD